MEFRFHETKRLAMPINSRTASLPSATDASAADGTRNLHRFLKFVLLLLFCFEFVFWTAFLLSSLRNRADFRQLYVAGCMARSGHLHQLYDLELQHSLQNSLVSPEANVLPFIRPSYSALLFAPLSFLSYKVAYFFWLMMNLFLLGASFRLSSPGRWERKEVWPAAAFLLFVPIQIALMQGQDSILLLMLLSWSFVLLNRDSEFAAGMISALGLFKFQLILPMVLLFALKRRWNFIAGFTLIAAILGCVSIWLVGFDQMRLYVQQLRSIGLEPASPKSLSSTASWTSMATLKGLVFGLGGSHISLHAIQVSSILLSAGLILAVALAIPKATPSAELFTVSVVAGVLAGTYVFAHDLSILLLPLMLALRSSSGRGDLRRLGYAATAVFTSMLIEFYSPRHFYLVSLFLILFLWTMAQSIRNRRSLTAGGV